MAAERTRARRGAYRKSAATRNRILDAAVEVFGSSGFEGGSLREVAARATISEAGLLHHFPSKAALLEAVVARRDEDATARGQFADTGIGWLAWLVKYARESANKPQEIELFAVLSAEATRPDHPAHEYMRGRYQWVSALLRDAFEQARTEGHLRAQVDPARATSHLIALWDGLQLQWLLQGQRFNIADELEAAMDDWLVAPLAELRATA